MQCFGNTEYSNQRLDSKGGELKSSVRKPDVSARATKIESK